MVLAVATAGTVEGTPALASGAADELTTTGTPGDVASLAPSATAPSGQDLVVFARSANDESVPGGHAGFFVTVSNGGKAETPAGEAISIALGVPEGMSFDGVTTLSGDAALSSFPTGGAGATGAKLVCPSAADASSMTVVRCTWGTGVYGAVTPASVGAGSQIVALVEFSVASSFPATHSVTTRTMQVSLDDPGNTASSATSTSAQIAVVAGDPTPVFFPDVNGSQTVSEGASATESIRLLNVGSGAATATPGHPTATVSNLLPPGFVGSWSSDSPGWTCSGPSDASPTCTFSGGSIPVAGLAPALDLTYSIAGGSAARLGLQPGGAPSLQRWNIAISGSGLGHEFSTNYPAQVAIQPSEGSALFMEASTSGGLDQLLPGANAAIDVRLSNIGAAPTAGAIDLKGTLPRGLHLVGLGADSIDPSATAGSQLAWSCTSNDGGAGFTCTPSGDVSIPQSGSTEVVLHLAADTDARPTDGVVSLSAQAENQIEHANVAHASVPIFILPGNVGFPRIALSNAIGGAAIAPVTDGAPAHLLTGDRLSERLDLVNAGGAPIAAGAQATVRQRLTRGVKVTSIHAPSDERCRVEHGATTNLVCVVRFADALAPAATLRGPVITVADSRPTSGTANWAATVRLDGEGSPPAATLPIYAIVKGRAPALYTHLRAVELPTAGGVGRFEAIVGNSGDANASGEIHTTVHLPAGASHLTAHGTRWGCTDSSASVAVCTSSATVRANQQLSPITFTIAFDRASSGRNETILAQTATGHASAPRTADASMTIQPRAPITARIHAPDTVALDAEPLVKLAEPVTPTTVTLEGDGSGGNGLGLTYHWVQECTSKRTDSASAHCSGLVPAVSWLNEPKGTVDPATADVSFVVPHVSRVTSLRFALTISDGSATSTATTTVKVVPPTPAKKGFAIEHPHVPADPSGPLTETVRLPSADRSLRAHPRLTSSTHGASRVVLTLASREETTTTAPGGESTTTTEPATTTTEPATTTTVPATTTTTAPALSGLFCELVTDAVSGKNFSGSISGVSLSLGHLSASDSTCSSATTVSFSDSSIGLASYLSATGVGGSISKDGITINAGTLTGPDAWHAPKLSLAPSSDSPGIVLAFGSGTSSATSLSISGSVTAPGLAFVPLPSGWSATTMLSFSTKAGATAVELAANGTGPASDTSPNSPKPTISITGSVASTGTFSLSANLQRLVQLQGSAINLTGTIARASASGPIAVSVKGSLASPLTIVRGLTLNSLSVAIAPTDTSLGLSGSGSLTVQTPSGSLGVAVTLAYDNPKNWALTATGAGTASWTPLPGLTIAPGDVHGSISAVDGSYHFSLAIAPKAAWTPTTGLSVSGLTLALSSDCPDTGAVCPTGASAFFHVTGAVALSLPSVGSLSTTLDGVLALPTGAFSVTAALAKPLDLGAGISIDKARVTLSKDMPVAPGTATPTFDGASTTGLAALIVGAVTLPKFGALPEVDASWSSSGWAIAAPLGNYQLPGQSGDGSSLKNAVLGWASFKTSLSMTDPTTKKLIKIALPTNTFTVSGSFSAPAWFTSITKLPANTSGEATGTLNLSNGDFALKMGVSTPDDAYLYGSATSATNVKLSSVYLEIDRSGADFNVALGGAASLHLAAMGSSPASNVDLSVALGYAAVSQTVSGTLSLSSAAGWQDAFGLSGLTLFDLAVSFQLNLATLVPGLGFGARAVLPANVRGALGMPSGARTTLVANISLTNPCLGIAVDDPSGRGLNVLDLGGKGALTAKQFDVEIAPDGCTVGQFHYDPGVSLNFDGAVLGVSVAIAAHLTTSPFAFDASIDVGDFTVAGVTVDRTHLAIAYKTGGTLKIEFAGGIHLLGTGISVAGAYAQTPTSSTIDLQGKLDDLTIASTLTVKNAAVSVHVVTGKTASATFAASGSVDLLGQTVNADFKLGVVNGQLIEAHANVVAAINVAGVGLNGTFHLDYGPSTPFAVNANVVVSVGGFTLANATATIKNTQFTLSAVFGVPGVFSANVTGAFYWGAVPSGTTITGPGGTKVAAKAGDFYLSAKDVSLTLAGFSAKGSIEIGRANGSAWAALSTNLQLLGTASGNSIAIAGSISGNGDFSFTGTGNLNLVGVNASVTATVKRTGTNVTVSGAATLSVLGSSASLAGTFAYDNGTPHFRLTGSGKLSVGGYNLADASFFFSNFPSDAGLSATINTNFANVVTLSGRLTVVQGTRFYFGVNATVDFHLLKVPASVVLTNCTNSSCSTAASRTTLTASASFSYGGFSFGVSTSIGSDGSFSATARSPVSGTFYGRTGELSLAVVSFYADFSYAMSVTVSNRSPYLAISGSGSGNVYGHSWGCSSGWFYVHCGWGGWSRIIGVGASISTPPLHVCGSVYVWGVSFSKCI